MFILAIQISAIVAFSEDAFQSAFHPRSSGRRRIVAAAPETKSGSRNSMLTRSKYSNKLPHPLVPRFPVLKTDAFSDESAEVVYNPIIRHKFIRPVKHGDNSSEESDEILPPYNDTNPGNVHYSNKAVTVTNKVALICEIRSCSVWQRRKSRPIPWIREFDPYISLSITLLPLLGVV